MTKKPIIIKINSHELTSELKDYLKDNDVSFESDHSFESNGWDNDDEVYRELVNEYVKVDNRKTRIDNIMDSDTVSDYATNYINLIGFSRIDGLAMFKLSNIETDTRFISDTKIEIVNIFDDNLSYFTGK
jgi:hypothetical protein